LKFIGDFHIHSHFSRATAKNSNLESLYCAARIKGISVIGTGDFTHPGWFAEIQDKLIPAEPGLFKLKPEISKELDKIIPASCNGIVRFLLTAEISNIYKKNEKTRKNHNICFAPDLNIVSRFNRKLDKIGNIKSDGRPILGLDARNLLEILLETSKDAYLVPAHIWTPWFSLLGSKSGFDSIKECFEDLTPHIFAIETGLSSDPPMNWRISFLDNITLISNSDAHSPDKLGREANIFDTELSYYGIRSAIETGNGFKGTFEFYPEEGKYHLDGHRKCDIRLTPEETIQNKGICPVCKKPVTLGVLYRISQLADKPYKTKNENAPEFKSLIPLKEILSEIHGVGVKTKKVGISYNELINKFGPEFSILNDFNIDELKKSNIPLIGEAISRVRKGKIILNGGYDGEFGTIKIFDNNAKKHLSNQKSLFIINDNIPIKGGNSVINKNFKITKNSNNPCQNRSIIEKNKGRDEFTLTNTNKHGQTHTLALNDLNDHTGQNRLIIEKKIFQSLNKRQIEAVKTFCVPLIIKAGPGTGKTRTLTHRIAYLILVKKISPKNILAVTFTQKAALEMQERLSSLLNNKDKMPFISTFHSICFDILKEESNHKKDFYILDNDSKKEIITNLVLNSFEKKSKKEIKKIILNISFSKQKLLSPFDDLSSISKDNDFSEIYKKYTEICSENFFLDYEDLIFKTYILFSDKKILTKWQNKFLHICVDEYQDLNYAQYNIIKLLAGNGENLCVIGDPDQSIYGFQGSDAVFFQNFSSDFKNAKLIELNQNYRSTETILKASSQILMSSNLSSFEKKIYSGINGDPNIHLMTLKNEKSEAVSIVKKIETLVGGTSHFSIDSGFVHSSNNSQRTFSDFAVLYRINEQAKILADVFEKSGIPFQIASKDEFQNNAADSWFSLFKIIEGYGTEKDINRLMPILNKKYINTINKLNLLNINKNSFIKLLNEFLKIENISYDNIKNRISNNKDIYDFISWFYKIKKHCNNMTVSDRLSFLLKIEEFQNMELKDSNYAKNIIQTAHKYQNESQKLITNINFQDDVDTIDLKAEKVSLMTMHSSKGLEFSVVFICGCEKGLIPFERYDYDVDISEERRLFYVAVTRARDIVYLTNSQNRTVFGKTLETKISPFIDDMEEKIKLKEKFLFSKKRVKKASHIQLKLI